MADVRPKWQTVIRPNPLGRPMASAASDTTCPCGREVLESEPIVCIGGYLIQEDDGTRSVDLSGAEWRCQRCVGGEVAAHA